MAGKHKDGLAPELLDKLIVQRGARGALDFESLATELKKAWPSACWVRSWSSICPIRRNWKPGNHRNGISRKTVDSGSKRIMLDIPRDRLRGPAGCGAGLNTRSEDLA